MVVKDYELDLTTDDRFLHVWNDATPEDWERLADKARFVELMEGKLIVHSPVALGHQKLVGFLYFLLTHYLLLKRNGQVFLGPFTMDLGLSRKFQPDLFFVGTGRTAQLIEDRLLGPADLAIEVGSRSTQKYDQGEKRDYYAQARVEEYWIVDPFAEKVFVDRPAGSRVMEVERGIVESSACPGWWIRAEWLWQDPLPNALTCIEELLGRAR